MANTRGRNNMRPIRGGNNMRRITQVRSLQIKIFGDKSTITKARVVDTVKRVGERLGLEKTHEDREPITSEKRGTIIEFRGKAKPVLKVWKVDEHYLAVHARDQSIAAQLVRELCCALGDKIDSGDIKMVSIVDNELVGGKRELDYVAKLPWFALGFKVEHGTVKKGGREHKIIRIKAGDRVVLKIYVRAPRKLKWKVGGRGGAWGAESSARVRVIGGTPTGPAGDAEAIAHHRLANRIAKRLARNPKRAAEFVERWLELQVDTESLLDLLGEFGIVRAPDRIINRMWWILAADKAVRELLYDERVARELNRRRKNKRKTSKLDKFIKFASGSGPP